MYYHEPLLWLCATWCARSKLAAMTWPTPWVRFSLFSSRFLASQSLPLMLARHPLPSLLLSFPRTTTMSKAISKAMAERACRPWMMKAADHPPVIPIIKGPLFWKSDVAYMAWRSSWILTWLQCILYLMEVWWDTVLPLSPLISDPSKDWCLDHKLGIWPDTSLIVVDWWWLCLGSQFEPLSSTQGFKNNWFWAHGQTTEHGARCSVTVIAELTSFDLKHSSWSFTFAITSDRATQLFVWVMLRCSKWCGRFAVQLIRSF